MIRQDVISLDMRPGADVDVVASALAMPFPAGSAATFAWIMNSSIRRCASSRAARRCGRPTVGVQDHLSLGEIDRERLAPVAPAGERRVGRPERLQDGVEQRPGRGVRIAVDRRLRLLVGELCRGAHHHPMEFLPELPAVGVEAHADGKGRAGLAFAAASRGRWRCAPAAWARRGRGNRPSCRAFPPRGRGPSRGGRSRRRRRSRPSPRSRRVLRIGLGMHRSSWSRASGGSIVTSGSSVQSSRCAMSAGRPLRRVQHRRREDVRNAVLLERDQADRLLARHIAEPFDHAARREGRSGSA